MPRQKRKSYIHPNHSATVGARLSDTNAIIELKFKELDAQIKTLIVLIGDLRKAVADLHNQLDVRCNTLTRQVRDGFKAVVAAPNDTPANAAIRQFLYDKNQPDKAIG